MLAGASLGADEPGRAEGYRRQIMARRTTTLSTRLSEHDAPVFICGGRYDGIAPIANQEALLREIPGARMELFEGGHAFLSEDPRAFERVIAFLKGARLHVGPGEGARGHGDLTPRTTARHGHRWTDHCPVILRTAKQAEGSHGVTSRDPSRGVYPERSEGPPLSSG